MGYCEDWSIDIGNWDVFRYHDVCSSLTAIFSDVEICRIGVPRRDHVSGLVGDSIIGVCNYIIQELIYRFVGGFSGGGLLLPEFSE